ncbi:MAG: hypothetical protein PVH29_00080 [Candidatus Zixiibacteriota bacterium]
MVWSDATLAALRRVRPGARVVSFGWDEYSGGWSDVALGEEGMDFAANHESYRVASALASSWYISGGKSYLTWDGVPLGAAAQIDLFRFFQLPLRLYFVLEHIIKRYEPSRVTFVRDGSARALFLARVLDGCGIRWDTVGRRSVRGSGPTARAFRRYLWPAMFLAARRRARQGRAAVRKDLSITEPGGVVFWGQFDRLEFDVYEGFCRSYGREVPYFAGALAAARQAGAAGIKCSSIFDRMPPRGETRKLFRKLAADFKELERAGLFAGIELPPGLADYFRAKLPFRPGTWLVTIAMFATAVEAFLERWRPSLIVHMSDAHMAGRLVSTLAGRRGVPTLVIQNHITGGPTFGYLPLSSSRMAAWGDVSRDWMIAGGAPPEKVVVTGSPYAALAARKCNELNRPGKRKAGSLVLATNILSPDENRALARACASYSAQRGRRLVVRPHPVEADALYRAIISRAGLTDAVITKDTPLEEVLADAAVVVMSQSGVGVDAVAAGVPFIYVNLAPDVPDYIPYVRYGAAAGVRDLGRLERTIDDVLHAPPGSFDRGREAFGRAYLGTDAGDPFDNLADLARELEGER